MRTDCYPISTLPGLSRLFLDYTGSHEALAPFFPASPWGREWMAHSPAQDPALRSAVADLLAEQNRAFGAGAKTFENIERLRSGAGAVVSGGGGIWDVGLFFRAELDVKREPHFLRCVAGGM